MLFIETGGHESPRVETLNRCSTKRSIHKVSSSLALSRAFEPAFIAQTVVRPITNALQNGFKIVGQPGRMAKEANEMQLADLCLATLQGAMLLGKVRRNAQPVEATLRELLTHLKRYVPERG